MSAHFTFLWDAEDDPHGNATYLAEHFVTPEEAEHVVENAVAYDESEGQGSDALIAFGHTADGRFLAILFDLDEGDFVYVRNGYDAPEP